MAFATKKLGVAGGYWLVPVFGALGGIVGGVLRNDNKLMLCAFEDPNTVKLGILGDVVVGLGGSSSLVFLFGGTLLQFDPNKAESLVLVVSVSFVAGVFGRNIVEAAGERLIRKAREEARSVAKEETKNLGPSAAIAYSYAARDSTNRGSPEKGLELSEEALRYDPNYANAYIEKGRALKRLNRLDQALAAVEAALRINQNEPKALYNRACYRALLHRPIAEITADLARAFELQPGLRQTAVTDPDFVDVRPQIDQLLQPQAGPPGGAPPGP